MGSKGFRDLSVHPDGETNELLKFPRSQRSYNQTDMARSTRLVSWSRIYILYGVGYLIKNIYNLWGRNRFLLSVTYFSTNLVYRFTLFFHKDTLYLIVLTPHIPIWQYWLCFLFPHYEQLIVNRCCCVPEKGRKLPPHPHVTLLITCFFPHYKQLIFNRCCYVTDCLLSKSES